MNENQYKKHLAKNQDCAIFHVRDTIKKLTKLCMETPCWCPFEGHKYGRRKQKDSSVFEFFYKSVNSSLEELTKIKVIFILKQEMLRQQNLKKKSVTLSAYMRAVQAAIYMPRHPKSFGNSSVPISQHEEHFRTEYLYTAISRKFVGKSARDNPERYCGWF